MDDTNPMARQSNIKSREFYSTTPGEGFRQAAEWLDSLGEDVSVLACNSYYDDREEHPYGLIVIIER